MNARRRVWIGLAMLTGVALVGTLWYWLVERFSLVDSLYQSVTTISTVGFREVHDLGGRGRVFTIGLIVVGVGFAFYTLVVLVEELVGHHFTRWGRRRMERRIDNLDSHIVLCGYGRVGVAIGTGGQLENLDRLLAGRLGSDRLEQTSEA